MMADDEELLHRIGRLERRIDRERRARAAAEQIAEAGLRSLYDANVELDGRILERTNELYRALEVAEAANNAKSLFLGQMSHQINTPLNGLLGMLELLSTELHDPQIREWHASAVRSARRLERMTTRLITYVELEHAEDLGEANRFRPIQDLLAAVYDRWHMTCIRGGQLLAVEVATGMNTVVVHSEEIDLLFDELMSNVVEHAGPGAVTISAESAERSNEMLITIRDPGPGVDPEVVHLLHDLSGSPDQTRRPDAKVNLGLALVDRIIQAHGGRWTPLDEAGAGSAIAVVLPARPSFAPG